MKLLFIAGAIALAATSTVAAAQDRVVHREVVKRTVVTRHTERNDNGWHNRRHKVCNVRWVHHHKVRRCFWR